MCDHKRSAALIYGFAFLSVAAAFGIRLLSWPLLGTEAPFLFFVAAVVLAAWFGGFGPGAVATLLSAPLISLYFLDGQGTNRFFDSGHFLQLTVFTVIGLLISWLVENLHAARRRSQEAELEARNRAAEADESKRILDALMEYIPEGIIITEGQDVRVKMISRYGLELSGQPAEAVVGVPLDIRRRLWQVCRPGGVTPAEAAELPLSRATKSGEIIRGEEWLLGRAGSRFTPILCNAGPIRDKDGRIFGSVIAWSDITELKKAASELESRVRDRTAELARINAELEAERLKFFSFLDTLPFFVCLVAPDHSIRFANRCFHGLFPGAGEKPDFQIRTCREASRDHCPVCRSSGFNQQTEWQWTSSAGRHYRIYEHPFSLKEDDCLVLAMGIDITEHEQAEEKLRKNEDFMRKILDTLPVGVWICEKDGRLVRGNPRAREIWHGARNPAAGENGEYKGWWLKSGKRIRGEEWALARAILKGETSLNEEIEIECFDGTHKIILNSAAPVREEDRAIIGAIVVHQDITEMKRVEEERARKHQQLESLWKISRKVDASLEGFLDHVLAEMVVMSESPHGFIGFIGESNGDLSVRSLSAEAIADCKMPPRTAEFPISKAGLLSEAIVKQKPLIVNRYGEQERDRPAIPAGHVPLRKLLVVPVVRDGRTILLGAVANKEKDYTDEDVEQIHAFLVSAMVVMEKKQAEEALKESQARLQCLSSELLTAQEAERRRISRELHDELGQALTMIKLRVSLIEMNLGADKAQIREHCRSATEQIDRAIEDTRRLSRDLIPAALENLGLVAALRRLAADSTKASHIGISVDVDDIDHLFPPQSSILLYRVFQESLNNVMKHSDATQVKISAREKSGLVVFRVEDNGKGINLEEVEAKRKTGRHGLGLAIMSERVRTLGARLEIQSRTGAGTSLSFSVPAQQDGG